MRDALANRLDIARRITDAGTLVMLDFDGTLAPIVSKPKKARMSAGMRQALILCARRFSVAIVTGRSLADAEKLTRIGNVSLVGNHGLEWRIDGKRSSAPISFAMRRAVRTVYRDLLSLEKQYTGVYIEDKTHSISVHYKQAKTQHKEIRREVRLIVRRAGLKNLRIVGGLFMLNILPNAGWDKGRASLMATRLRDYKKALPIFIGDDVTDEDAFLALRHGITIHVKNGKNVKTSARYTLNNVDSVRRFLLWLASLN
jgi:trehalose-phosphatase